MKSLAKDLHSPKYNLDEFVATVIRVLRYLPDIVSQRTEYNEFVILSSDTAGTTKFARPINTDLFIFDPDEYVKCFDVFRHLLEKIKNREEFIIDDCFLIDSVVYTTQQSLGVGMDFLCNPNGSRKHVGNRFEELIRLIIIETGVVNDKIVFKIPYPSDDGEKMYSCETDLILSPHKKVKSNVQHVDKDEIVVSLKTSSKDRMGKIFLDKLLMQKFAKKDVKVVGIFLNDVQRKESNKVSYTFVSGLFMVYTQFLTELEGVYFVDSPPTTLRKPWNEHISSFSEFLVRDMWTLLAS